MIACCTRGSAHATPTDIATRPRPPIPMTGIREMSMVPAARGSRSDVRAGPRPRRDRTAATIAPPTAPTTAAMDNGANWPPAIVARLSTRTAMAKNERTLTTLLERALRRAAIRPPQEGEAGHRIAPASATGHRDDCSVRLLTAPGKLRLGLRPHGRGA